MVYYHPDSRITFGHSLTSIHKNSKALSIRYFLLELQKEEVTKDNRAISME